jgi:hypothetical protein
MAGLAPELAQVAVAAVDAGDDAQRLQGGVEHRALLDVDLDETEVARRVAPERRDGIRSTRQPDRLHGLAHRQALGVALFQPLGPEAAGQCAAGQEGGGEALALLFGEGDQLQAHRQTPAVQTLHGGHGDEDAEAAVVLAGVAHGVEVAAGEQPLLVLAPALAPVAADHIAHGVDLGAVEAAGQHPTLQVLGAGAVRRRGNRSPSGVRACRCGAPVARPSPRPARPRRGSRPARRPDAARQCGGSGAGTPANSVSGCACRRRSKVSMICVRLRPVPRGPRTARMKGQPKRAL